MMVRARARAQINIALVKYWGKRDTSLNLPEAGSLSLTLDGLGTTTTVVFDDDAPRDTLTINEEAQQGSALTKATRVLDALRERAGLRSHATITSHNSVPTSAGLASSASGLAALTQAAAVAAGLNLSREALSATARLGSGSACRSLFGGFAEWSPGKHADGHDSHAHELFGPDHWDLHVLVAILARGPKSISSTEGMEHTRRTSPFHAGFIATVSQDLQEAKAAIAARDLMSLAPVAERSCLRMHADMLAADPPLCYLQPASWAIIHRVQTLRKEGVQAFFSADAGPNVKVFCTPEEVPMLHAELEAMPGVKEIIICRPGHGAEVLDPIP
ncbi:MAG: diphosphomevalonate decarboxylase [Deltaproteobacteria bacterium]|nr:diphosphomevalonate decarboxylase [Deltaproteobacteria bacterium]